MNPTLEKFGYPDSVIKSYQHWSVLLRPQQVTLGCLVLGAHSQEQAFGNLPKDAMTELSEIIKHIEHGLTHCFNYDKINYLMLMMVDPNVHFHVIPRYENPREFGSLTLIDNGWPGPPDLGAHSDFDKRQLTDLLNLLRENWVV